MKVTDIEGNVQDIKYCYMLAPGKYALIEDCITLGSQIYHKNSPEVCIDARSGSYIFKKGAFCIRDTSISGVAYTAIKLPGDIIINKDIYLSYEAVKAAGLIEDVFGNRFVSTPKDMTKNPIIYRKFSVQPEVSDLQAELIDLKGNVSRINSSHIKKMTEIGMHSPSFISTEGLKYRFGVEIETSIGAIPEWVASKLPISCVFDGSLRGAGGSDPVGGEYVTTIMQGDTGLQQLRNIIREISLRCNVDKRCSVHVHISDENLNVDRDTTVNVYILAKLLENELFSMMPESRRNNSYCNPLNGPKIDLKELKKNYNGYIADFYEKLQVIVAVNKDVVLSKKKNHPLGHHCNYNKETPRYWWLNFVPTMFNTRGTETYSVEFRMHGGTLNYRKIKNWIMICMAIYNFASNHHQKISEKITLAEVLSTVYKKNAKSLIEYINTRKRLFSTSESEASEYARNSNENETLTDIKSV